MTTKNELTESTKVESASFELQLPDKLKIPPWAVIELPRKQQAMIYDISTIDDKGNPVTRYDVYVVLQKNLKQPNPNHYHQTTRQFTNLPAIAHYLFDLTAHLSVKRKTRTVKMIDADDGDDDE